MKNWMDLNGDGKMDGTEMMFAEEMLCTSREEHEALFGDAGDFEDDAKDDFEIDAMAAGLDVDELERMNPDDRTEALEEASPVLLFPPQAVREQIMAAIKIATITFFILQVCLSFYFHLWIQNPFLF